MNISSNISAPFIRRPVATTLLTIALFMAGSLAFKLLPVSPLPQVDFPTINVSAGLPGASPETMASSVATPLERQFGRIASVTEMTSTSQLGSTNVTIQFDLNRNIDAAARDVQAAINAARSQLPAGLPTQPTYRKVNPADSPIILLSLTSSTVPKAQVYDAADSIVDQKLSQIPGVGQVSVGGGAQPAVRVDVNPAELNSYGISLEQVRAALGSANANRPKGQLSDKSQTWNIATTDQLYKAWEYRPLLVTYRNGAAVRLQDVANVVDSVADVRSSGYANGEPAITIVIFRQPGANILETVDRVRAALPLLQASIPPTIHLGVILDRTPTIRASIRDVEITLVISIVLVVLVVFAFLRSLWATAIPSVAVPLSLVGTFGVMYLAHYTLDNLSLMALTISTGFVVDDAIVVIENITRYLEAGLKPMEAALRGSREIGFTVLSMSTSLVAVFIPILLMGGVVGRLFREFAVTLSTAIGVSLMVSLTTTPMMCARFLKPETHEHGLSYRIAEGGFEGLKRGYEICLRWVLRHQPFVLALTLATICLSVYLYIATPKGFFPQQDTGRLSANIVADQDVSFPAMDEKLREFEKIVRADPAVDTVGDSTGGSGYGGPTNTGRMFIQLKPIEERKLTVDQVIARIRTKAAKVPGATLYLTANQDVSVGARRSNSQYQYTLEADNLSDLNQWAPILLQKITSIPEIKDANSDQQIRGLSASLIIDRDVASRLGVSMSSIDNTLNDSFGQREVSTIYRPLNQYYVILEVAPQYSRNPETLKQIYVPTNRGSVVPLSAFSHYGPALTPLTLNHQGQVPAITLSFNLAPGASLGKAYDDIIAAERQVGLPPTVRGTFQGTAAAFADSLSTMPLLILTALGTVYIVLGILYESYIHPITILSTVPSAGVGALLALMLFKTDLSIIALIGIILLIGIVKKNAILMIDFALQAERMDGKSPVDAIHQACVLRFRPIMMTTMAAMLGAVPLAIGGGTGSELRQPLGITIVGGLIFSQMLTLFTTPVVYLYMDRLQTWFRGSRAESPHRATAD
ncbi:MAG TPA: multidrug efflux RND transporter permease subunit [Candidatus Acidoferrales bacterium]|jgi:multidrug efflux pump|nr:multidrug efflux RND transporter permease subunit [Candidatus Acidoferrales bacterium]